MDAILVSLRPAEPDQHDIDVKVSHFITLAREVHRAAELVILEGPPPLAEAAERITHASDGLSQVMRRMVENAQAGRVERKINDTALATERERLLYEAVKSFRLVARETLGSG